MTGLKIPSTDEPQVSILMVLYGHADLALSALRSVVEHADRPMEVVVVDNASPDGAGEVVAEHVQGLRYVASAENLGFGQGMNRAAGEARASLLCLLNSDVVVGPGWMEALLEPLEQDPRVGAVVPRFVYPDGRLQEAGSTLGCDGVTWAIGGYATEGLPAFDVGFPRWVDYGSAACMTLRRSDFEQVGFDPVYGIGYFEDVELCMELARRGLRVRYEPACEIVHVLGASSQDLAPQLSRDNREIFVGRWPDALRGRPPLADVGKNVHRVVHARDWTTPVRLLLAGPCDDALGSAFVDAARPWTLDVRLTVAGAAAEGSRARGVEVVEVPDRLWFRSRLDHATAVVLRDPAFAVDVEETQPLAAIVVDLTGGAPTSAFGQPLRRAAVVIVGDDAQADRARALAPDALVLLIDAANDPAELAARALAHAGVVAPAG